MKLLIGGAFSNIADSIYSISAMWLVYELTNDPFYTGVAGFLSTAPSALQFLFGPIVDRIPLRKLFVTMKLAQAGLISILPLAYHFNRLNVYLVLSIMPVMSGISKMAYPTAAAAIPRLAGDEELVQINSVFNTTYKIIDLLSDGITGALVATVGVVALLTVDVVVFVLSAAVLTTLFIPSTSADSPEEGSTGTGMLRSYLSDLKKGGQAVYGTVLMWLMIARSLANFMSGVVIATMPAYAAGFSAGSLPAVFQGAGAYGLLMSAYTVGNIAGAAAAGKLPDASLGKTIIIGFSMSIVSWVIAIRADFLPVTAAFIAIAFVPSNIIGIQISSTIQSVPPERFVGRISSLNGSATYALVPLGSVVGGIIASKLSPQITMYLYALGPAIYVLIVLLRKDLRQLPKPSMIDWNPNIE